MTLSSRDIDDAVTFFVSLICVDLIAYLCDEKTLQGGPEIECILFDCSRL